MSDRLTDSLEQIKQMAATELPVAERLLEMAHMSLFAEYRRSLETPRRLGLALSGEVFGWLNTPTSGINQHAVEVAHKVVSEPLVDASDDYRSRLGLDTQVYRIAKYATHFALSAWSAYSASNGHSLLEQHDIWVADTRPSDFALLKMHGISFWERLGLRGLDILAALPPASERPSEHVLSKLQTTPPMHSEAAQRKAVKARQRAIALEAEFDRAGYSLLEREESQLEI